MAETSQRDVLPVSVQILFEFAFVSFNRLQIPSGNEGITELQMLLKDMWRLSDTRGEQLGFSLCFWLRGCWRACVQTKFTVNLIACDRKPRASTNRLKDYKHKGKRSNTTVHEHAPKLNKRKHSLRTQTWKSYPRSSWKERPVFVLYEATERAGGFPLLQYTDLIILIDPVSTHKQRGIKTKPGAKKLTLSLRERGRVSKTSGDQTWQGSWVALVRFLPSRLIHFTLFTYSHKPIIAFTRNILLIFTRLCLLIWLSVSGLLINAI